MQKGIAIVVAVLIVIAAIGGYFVYPLLNPTPTVKPKLEGDIPIGVLYSSSSEAGYFKPSYDIAFEEVNEWCKSAGLPVRFVPLEENAEESTTKLVEKAESLIARGCQVILGTSWSTHVAALKSTVDEKKIVLFSPSSGSPAVEIAGDYIFRNVACIPQWYRSHVALAKSLGIEAMIVLYSQDSFGQPGNEAMLKLCQEYGITVYKNFGYDPSAKDFTAEASVLEQTYKEAVAKYGKEKVGVNIIGVGGMCTPWLTTIAKFPSLWDMAYFQGPNAAGATDVLQYAGEIASKTGFLSAGPMAAMTPKTQSFIQKHLTKYGSKPYTYGYNAYDTVWITALSILAAGEYKGETIKAVLPKIAESYFGTSGLCTLNEYGDRVSINFVIQKIVFENGTYKWKDFAYFDSSTMSVTIVGK
ncbi:MAG: ABC transporter substrate-binding protein [Nitrososphaeria archaeon]